MDEDAIRFLPDTDADRSQMLKVIGMASSDELFEGIPDEIRKKADTAAFPEPLDETALLRHMGGLAAMNRSAASEPCFLGAGAYDHFSPVAVRHLAGRSEFVTAYTPYQAEMSQGMLQAIFEYQSLVAGLYGMDGANASLYDGATAVLEGIMLAVRATGRRCVLLSSAIHPETRQVVLDALRHSDIRITLLPILIDEGRTDLSAAEALFKEDTAVLVLQSPNFFGIPEDLRRAADMAHPHGALLCASCDPVSIGVLKSPGELGVDIAAGEGQPLGLPMSFGGPWLGLFAVKAPLIRHMPGRLVGETRDIDGRRGFVLTLQAREQHIRRERAASNICTNQALCALTAAVHLSLLGPEGLRGVARQCVDNSVWLHDRLVETGLARRVFSSPFFREFAVRSVLPPSIMNEVLRDAGILGGADVWLTADGPLLALTCGASTAASGDENPAAALSAAPGATSCPDKTEALPTASQDALWLVAVTEKRTMKEMERLISVLLADPRVKEAIGI